MRPVRYSQAFIPTLKEAPADAQVASHKLLVRGGFIRQVSAGIWTFLPLGWRVHRKIEQMLEYLLRANHVPLGTVLLTGTGIIVPAESALAPGDVVTITVPQIGSLRNEATLLT